METKKISLTQITELSSLFNKALLSDKRLKTTANLLIEDKAKINDMVFSLFEMSYGHNFFVSKLFLPSWKDNGVSVRKDFGNDLMTIEQALTISEIFIKALNIVICSPINVDKIISDDLKLEEVVNDLFEMNPSFNLFEYKMFIQRAPLSNFKEVATWDHEVFIVCVADEICEPYGFKAGEKFFSPNGFGQETVIGVAPQWFIKGAPLVLWTASDSCQFRDPLRPVVGSWTRDSLRNI
jgi:hypothetical protein